MGIYDGSVVGSAEGLKLGYVVGEVVGEEVGVAEGIILEGDIEGIALLGIEVGKYEGIMVGN